MKRVTITNWAYGVSGTAMIFAPAAQDRERAAVEQRHQLDAATERLDFEIFAVTDHARQYLFSGDFGSSAEAHFVQFAGRASLSPCEIHQVPRA